MFFEHSKNSSHRWNWVPSPLIIREGRTFQKLSHLKEVSIFFLERKDKPEKGGEEFSVLQSFDFSMQDSHPSLYSTKTKHCINCIFQIHSRSIQKMLTATFLNALPYCFSPHF